MKVKPSAFVTRFMLVLALIFVCLQGAIIATSVFAAPEGAQRNDHSNHSSIYALMPSGGSSIMDVILDPPWSSTGSLGIARYYHTATLLSNGKVLVAGGYNNGVLASAELYDPATGLWISAGSMSIPRFYQTATLLPNGQVLIIGGTNGTTSVASAELYDPATGTWTPIRPMTTARYDHTATLLPNGKVLVVGGYKDGVGYLSSAELYNPATGFWETAGDMSAPSEGHSATLLPDGTVLVTGGANASARVNRADLYDPVHNTWSSTAPMSSARIHHVAILLLNGKVLVTGGASDSGYLSSAEIYDLGSHSWSNTNSMSDMRYYHSATLLANGQVLVAGGYIGGGSPASAEIYDPATEIWRQTSPLSSARNSHSAVLLPNGQVLIAGGYYNGDNILASAELYEVAPSRVNQTINVTINAPANALNGATFTVAATASSGLPVSYSSSGSCTNSGADFTITSGTGNCLVIYNQMGDVSYNAAPTVTQTVVDANDAPVITEGNAVNVTMSQDGVPNPFALTLHATDADSGDTLTWSISTLASHGVVSISGTGNSKVVGYIPTMDYSGADSFEVQVSDGALTDSLNVIVTVDDGWVATGAMSSARGYHTATLLPNGKVLVTGGYNNGVLASAELYDPVLGTWTTTGSMITARGYHTATLLPNGQVLVTGGISNSSVLASAEIYNPTTGAWTATGSMITAREFHTATLLPNGKVLVIGGYNSTGYLSSAELYDPATGAWTATGAMTNARVYHTATLLPNGQVLVTGGYNYGALSSTELYDPTTGTWTATGSMITARYYHTITLLPNSKALITGGFNNGVLSSSELYDPTTGAWTATGSMITARHYHTITLLPNGKALVTGGFNNGVLSSTELYDPTTGTWTVTSSMAQIRYLHAATLLPNGQVLVTGGISNSSFLASAELYGVAPTRVDQTISITTNAPASAMNGLRFTIAAISSSGLPVSYSSSGSCTNNGADFTITSGTGDCLVIYNQMGDFSYSAASTVTQTVSPNNIPIITEGSSVVVTMSEDGSPTAFALTLHATDLDSNTLTWNISSLASHGTATANGTGGSKTIGYSPNLNYSGTDSFDVQVSDGNGGIDTITVNVTIDLVNHAPIITAGASIAITMSEDGSPVPFALTFNATDADRGVEDFDGVPVSVDNCPYIYNPDQADADGNGVGDVCEGGNGDMLSWSISNPALHGLATASGMGPSKIITYTPNSNYNGSDKFEVQVSDGILTDIITVNVVVHEVIRWTTASALIGPHVNHTATLLLNGKVLVSGGMYDNGAELYDPSTSLWAFTGQMTEVRANHTATLLPSGKVLVVGGAHPLVDGSLLSLSSAELYNPNLGHWASVGSLAEGRDLHTATLLQDGRVLIAGGYDEASGRILASAEIYDPATGGWSSAGLLPHARYRHTATLLPDGKVLLVGGIDSSGPLASADLYDPATGVWTTTAPMSVSRYSHTATLLPNGKVLVVGGYGVDHNNIGYFASAELYDPSVGTWTATTGSMETPRGSHAATLLPDGIVLITGGLDNNGNSLANSELYNPATDTWSATGSLHIGRTDHTATLLTDGRVLIAGGSTNGLRTSSVELYSAIDNTPLASNVQVQPVDLLTGRSPVSLTFAQVTESGTTSLMTSASAPPLPAGFNIGNPATYYELSTTATFNGSVTLCINYTGVIVGNEANLTLNHYEGGIWVDKTTTRDTVNHVICASVNSFSPFVILEPAPPADQTITVNANAPASGLMGDTFTVSATASSELPVSYSASGACTNVGDTFTMVYGFGDCMVYYDQAGDASYNPAPQITEVVADANDTPVITEGTSVAATMSEDGAPIPFALTLHVTDADSHVIFVWRVINPPLHGSAYTSAPAPASRPGCGRDVVCPPSSSSGSNIISYYPDMNYTGSDSFDVQVSDGFLTDTITVNVTIENVNDAPVITESDPQAVTLSRNGSPTPFDLTLHATDVDGDPLTWSIYSPASNGTATTTSGAGNSNVIGYTPVTGYIGTDSFAVEASDGNLTTFITVNVTVEFTMIDQTITVTTNAPASAVMGGVFTVSATASSGLPVVYSASDACTNVGATFTMISGTGTCTVSYDQAGDANYNPAPQVVEIVVDANDPPIIAESDPQVVTMSEDGSPIPFGLSLHASDADNANELTWTISNPASHGTATILPRVCDREGRHCPQHASYTANIGYIPQTDYFGTDSFDVQVSDGALTDTITVNVTIDPIADDQSISVITNAPVSAAYGSSFTVEATASSNLQVLYTASGACTNIGADFTMTSATGTCIVMYDQAGDTNYNPAPQVTENVTAQKAVLTVTANAQSKVYGVADPVFTFFYSGFVGADGASNIDTPSTCNVTSAHVNVGNYLILCSGGLDDQYDFIYVSNDLTITPKPITVTADAQSKVYGTVDPALTYQVTSGSLENGDSFTGALTRASGENVGAYAIVQGTLSAGSNYNLTYTGANLTITKANQSITITTHAPTTVLVGGNFTVVASASSGLPVIYSASGACSNSGATFTVNAVGTCAVNYDQAGDSNYNAAPQVTETVSVISDTPLLLTPANGTQLLNNRPTFDWTDVFGATDYRIQISNNVGFTTTITNTVVTSSTYTPTADLNAGVTLYWRVQANTATGAGPWSVTRNFITAKPPSIPTLVAPANNALTTNYTPLIDWNNSTVPAGTTFQKYEVQLATDSLFTSPTSVDVLGPVTNSQYTPSASLDSNTTYYWQVRAYNTLGQYSSWSAVRSFRTALLPPALLAPNDTAQLLNNRPTFDWMDVPGVTGYRIQIANNIGFSPTLTNTVVTPSTYTPTADLTAGTTLYWRVQSNGTNGPSAWSTVQTLTTANPPSVPTLASPANNALVSGPSPLFNWNDSTLPAGVLFDHYQIQIATDNGFAAIVRDNNVSGITNSQDNTTVLPSGATYYWRVRSFNTLGHSSAWSTVRSVRIKFAGPMLALPVTGSTVSGLLPTFTWNAVAGATDYTIQVSKSSTFGTLVINTASTAPTFTAITNLQAGTVYYWRVRVNNPATYGPGDWSVVFTFTTP